MQLLLAVCRLHASACGGYRYRRGNRGVERLTGLPKASKPSMLEQDWKLGRGAQTPMRSITFLYHFLRCHSHAIITEL